MDLQLNGPAAGRCSSATPYSPPIGRKVRPQHLNVPNTQGASRSPSRRWPLLAAPVVIPHDALARPAINIRNGAHPAAQAPPPPGPAFAASIRPGIAGGSEMPFGPSACPLVILIASDVLFHPRESVRIMIAFHTRNPCPPTRPASPPRTASYYDAASPDSSAPARPPATARRSRPSPPKPPPSPAPASAPSAGSSCSR
jgi:hypothetical protein